MTDSFCPGSADREARAVAAEQRLAARLVEVERAEAEGRLFDLPKAVPSVLDQLGDFLVDPDERSAECR